MRCAGATATHHNRGDVDAARRGRPDECRPMCARPLLAWRSTPPCVCNRHRREQPVNPSRQHRLNILAQSLSQPECADMRPIASDADLGSLSIGTSRLDSGPVEGEPQSSPISSLPVSRAGFVVSASRLYRSPVAEVRLEAAGRPWRLQTHSSSTPPQNTFVTRAPRGCIAVQICLHGMASS